MLRCAVVVAAMAAREAAARHEDHYLAQDGYVTARRVRCETNT